MLFRDALHALAPLLDQLTAGVQLVDDEMRYQYLNPAAVKHGRSKLGALIGKTMEQCYPGIEKTEVYRLIQKVARTGKPDAVQNVFAFPDGSEGWFEVRIFKVPGGVVIMSVDITARKNLELHVRHADRMEAAGKLAGGIAHDFNNMLMIISSVAELSIEDDALPESHRRDLSTVLDATSRASELTRKLLGLSSQFPGGPAEIVPLGPFVESRLSTLRSVMGPSTRVHIEPPSEEASIRIDPGALDQLLIHLAKNAHDAMGDTGELFIGISSADFDPSGSRHGARRLPQGEYVCLTVRDTGPGITAEVIEKIFDPFYTTRGEGARGLGLAMCWGLVEQAGGTIQVHSTQGRGATFQVLFPRQVAEIPTVHVVPSSRPNRSTGARILVVDDEANVRKLVCALLERQGHSATGAANGTDALSEFMRAATFDLMISDLVMPGMTGMDLLREVRKAGHRTPVLLMSGYAPDHHTLRNVPPSCMLSKPFSAAQLKTAVDGMFGDQAIVLDL